MSERPMSGVAALAEPAGPGPARAAMIERPSMFRFSGSLAPSVPIEAVSDRERERTQTDDGVEVGPRPLDVAFDEAVAEPIAQRVLEARFVAAAGETMAALARQRWTWPMAQRPSRQARILALADAVLATGDDALADLLAWALREQAAGDPWALWPAIGLLSWVEGPRGLLAVEEILAGPNAHPEVVPVAVDALGSSPHPGLRALAHDLVAAPAPIAQAVGVELASRLGMLSPEEALGLLRDEQGAVVAAGIRAVVRLVNAAPPLAPVRALLDHEDADVAWEAARALTRWGAPDALERVRGGELAGKLGLRAGEILVMAGGERDLDVLERVVQPWLGSSAHGERALRLVGRFGHPLAWSFLVHGLGDRLLGSAAAEALEAICGPIVVPDGRLDAGAWRAAVVDADLDPALRYAFGKPWAPDVVAVECASGRLAAREVERRIDDLCARTGRPVHADLARWTPEAEVGLTGALESARAGAGRWRGGAWGR